MTVHPYHLDRYFDNFWSTTGTELSRNRYIQTASENAYIIIAPLVGVAKGDLTVNVVDNNLVVTATPSVKTRWSVDFKQTWVLNEDADVGNINAKLENGLLTLTVPRLKHPTRTVNVTIQ